MRITSVRIDLANSPTTSDPGPPRIRAYASVVIDALVAIHEIKVVEVADRLIVAMPSRKLTDRCPRCTAKNHLRARYCGECGAKLGTYRPDPDPVIPANPYHRDIAHPINQFARDLITTAVLTAYHVALTQPQGSADAIVA